MYSISISPAQVVQLLVALLPFQRKYPLTEGSGIGADEYRRNRRIHEGKLVTVHEGEIQYYWYDMEGPRWILKEPEFLSQREFLILHDGDHLTVYNPDGSIRWQGVIALEYESGFVPYDDDDPTIGTQSVFDQTVHGCQRGVDLRQWAAMFMRPLETGEDRKQEFLEAKLLKPAKPDYPS